MKKILFLSFFVLTFSTSHAQWTLTNGPESGDIFDLEASGNLLFAGSLGGGVARSMDEGNSWTMINNSLASLFVMSLKYSNGKLYAGVQRSARTDLYISSDSGNTWMLVNASLNNYWAHSISVQDSIICLSTFNGSLLLTLDHGLTWSPVTRGLTGFLGETFIVKDTSLFIARNGYGVYRSGFQDTIWTPVNTGISNLNVTAVRSCGNILFAGSRTGFFRSVDDGVSWTNVNGINTTIGIRSIEINGAVVTVVDSVYNLFQSNDSGNTWQAHGAISNNNPIFYEVVSTNSTVHVATKGHGVVSSIDSGITWSDSNIGLYAAFIEEMATNGNNICATVSGRGIAKSSDFGNTWTFLPNGNWPHGNWPNSSYTSIDAIIMDTSTIYISTFGNPYKTTDDGLNWTKIDSGIGGSVTSLALYNSCLYAGTTSNGAFKSTDDGLTWTAINSGISNRHVISFAFFGTDIFIGTDNGVYRSTDSGISWVLKDSGLVANLGIPNIVFAGNKLYGLSDDLYVSNDFGDSWSTLGSVIFSTSLVAIGDTIYLGTYRNGVYYYAPGNTTITSLSTGLANKSILALAAIGNQLFAGTYGGGVYTTQGILTSTEEENNISNELKLYPNPANEEISLQWDNHTFEFDEIQITNMMGQKINATQLNKDSFQTLYIGNLSPGIYLISIRDKGEIVTRKFLKQ